MARRKKVDPDAPAGLNPATLDQLIAGVSTPADLEAVFKTLKKQLTERILQAELTAHLGYPPGAPPVATNARNGTTPKTVRTDDGMLALEIPRDRDQLDDLRAPEAVRGIPMLPATRRTGDSGTSRHGDSAISKLLAYDASLREPTAIEYTPGPAKSSRWDSDSTDDTPIHAKAGW